MPGPSSGEFPVARFRISRLPGGRNGRRRLLYSGDVRAHGRKGKLFKRFVALPSARWLLQVAGPKAPHAGRALEASSRAPGMASESEVEDCCVELFRQTPGIVLACCSPLDVDRLVSLYKAARRSGRIFVMDLYAATVMRATRRKTLPQAVA